MIGRSNKDGVLSNKDDLFAVARSVEVKKDGILSNRDDFFVVHDRQKQ